jgi:hypothetical protein
MIENHLTGLVWNVMRRNPNIVRGLQRAGFKGGWVDKADQKTARRQSAVKKG